MTVQTGVIDVIHDFVDEFETAVPSPGAIAPAASRGEICGGVSQPGIFLHTVSEGWNTLRFPASRLPECKPGDRLFFIAAIGIRDGVPFKNDVKTYCDGVQFSILADGKELLSGTPESRTITSPGWRSMISEISDMGGKKVSFEFRTHPVGTSNYDWAVFGSPMLLHMRIKETEEVPVVDHKAFVPINWQDIREGFVIAGTNDSETSSVVTTSLGPKGATLIQEAAQDNKAQFKKGKMHLQAIRNRSESDPEQVICKLPGKIGRLGLFRFLPDIQIMDAAFGEALIRSGEPVIAGVFVKNTGKGTLRAESKTPVSIWFTDGNGSELFGPAEQNLPAIDPGASVRIAWRGLNFGTPAAYQLHAQGPNDTERTQYDEIFVYPNDEKKISVVLVERPRVKIELTPVGDLYRYGEIFTRISEKDDWNRIATIYPLAELVTVGLDPVEHELNFEGVRTDDGIKLETELPWIPSAENQSKIAQTYTWDSDRGLLIIETVLQTGSYAEILRFAGPQIAFGDGGDGIEHKGALFGGVEYLGSQDFSSSLLDADPPLHNRSIPHPRKIAVPMMAIFNKGSLVSVYWNPQEPWDDHGNTLPGAEFNLGAPESLNNYGKMQLSVPSISEWRKENELLGSKSYVMKDGNRIVLRQFVYVDHSANPKFPHATQSALPGREILAAMRKYLEIADQTEPPPPPRNWNDEKELSRQAFRNAVWSEADIGWRHCAGDTWAAQPSPGFAALLRFDAYTNPDRKLAEELIAFADKVMNRAIQERGPECLWSPWNCHIMEAEYPFYGGHLLEAMQGWRDAVKRTIKNQEKEGGWSWHPSSEKHKRLGQNGEQTSGTNGRHAWQILRYVRVTGDKIFLPDGLRGLEALERYRVPRGAQGWECPLHCPDILASAYGIRANVEAFRATQNAEYIEQARYWAWSGLPFVYHWNLEHLPAMRYATTPIFGTTHFTHSWIGVPVNWCGLVYAYGLQELSEFAQEPVWLQTAKGITTSTEWMQYDKDHPHAGCYPDSYNLMLETRFPADINPENILVNEYRLRGQGLQIKTIRCGARTISSGSRLISLETDKNEWPKFSSDFFEGYPAYTLIQPMPDPSDEHLVISVDGHPLERVENPGKVENGWRYSPQMKALEIKITYGAKPSTVEIRKVN